MKYNIVVSPEANMDLIEIVYYYTYFGKNLGEYFLREFDKVIAKIEDAPFLFRQIGIDTRRAIIKKFPYIVYFILIKNDLHIICVIHQRRKPKIWQQRLKEFKLKY